MTRCAYCSEPAVTLLDGDDLCVRHANEWVHGEGHAAWEREQQEAATAATSTIGTPASMLDGNAMNARRSPEGWANWVRLSESWGYD